MNASECNGPWCQPLYEAKAAGLILYGRALGLSHGEAEDVVQETFMALLQLPRKPDDPEHYCLRAFRNRAMNHHRGLWRRLARRARVESRRGRSRGHAPAGGFAAGST